MATNHDKPIGDQGIFRIRDLGSVVEVWVKAKWPATSSYKTPKSLKCNGRTYTGTFSYPKGAEWYRLHRVPVNYTQTVTAYIGRTGTSGLGGPHTFSVKIERPGGLVKHNGTHKKAEVYVKYNGVWRSAQPYVKIGGKWKECG